MSRPILRRLPKSWQVVFPAERSLEKRSYSILSRLKLQNRIHAGKGCHTPEPLTPTHCPLPQELQC